MKQLKAEITDELKQQVKVLAASRGESIQALVTRLLTDEVEINRMAHAIQTGPLLETRSAGTRTLEETIETVAHIEGLPAEEEYKVLHNTTPPAFRMLVCETCVSHRGHFWSADSKKYQCAYCGTTNDVSVFE
jgi:rubrerythrin